MTLQGRPRHDLRGDFLFIASASPEHVRSALQGLRASYAGSSLDVICRHEAIAATGAVSGCRVVHVSGTAQGRLGLVRRLRQTGYAAVAFVEAGDGGYVAMQVLPLVLGIPKVILVDERGQAHTILPTGEADPAPYLKLRISLITLYFSALFLLKIIAIITRILNYCDILYNRGHSNSQSTSVTPFPAAHQLPNIQYFASKREYDSVLLTSGHLHNPPLMQWQREVVRQWNFVEHFSSVSGYCSICGTNVQFTVNLQWGGGYNLQNIPQPNWRERVNCTLCGFNQRFRSSILIINHIAESRNSRIWIAEQVTPVYRTLKALYPNLIGSEYSPTVSTAKSVHALKILHQDVTNTTFLDNVFDIVCSFDVMEHVAAYHDAISEAFRLLVPGGYFLWPAPMDLSSDTTIVRASFLADSTIVHHLPPEYHGDPLGSGGSLCYQYFGWDVLDVLRACGFVECFIISVVSETECISPQHFVLARRP